ncbi:arylsulfatase [Allorhodopirellula solitaria]|uniref:Arylsulfatase n=1 Tax=Allorhodopirellula solitaria TaxID=2527987 RepID=A0A5C5YHR4_9BACT|nr:arylsulfatase [Allorhodopirellula solitaria]TWT73172.1 Arylsulfatase [Allorhodopirellula solitaria]
MIPLSAQPNRATGWTDCRRRGPRPVRHRLTTLVLASFAILLPPTIESTSLHAESSASPNVIVILADDQGWGDLSLHGNPNLSTPRIDSLARDGAQLENFYVCAVCSPTRAEFLTGRYHTRMGVYSTSSGGERFDADERTIADLFDEAGYATAAYGKWHSGMQWPYHPNARGFEDYYGFCSGHWGNYFDPMLEHNGRIVQGNGFLPDDLTQRTIDFIGNHRDRPFFVYLALNTPHSPMQVPQAYWDRFADREIVPDPVAANAERQDDAHTRAALAMCENIDDNVGRLLDHLDETGQAEDTIIVYFSDNGPNGWRYNGGMRGRKGATTEGGLRSPCLIRYPNGIATGTKVQPICAAIDLLPTLSEFAGINWRAEQLPGKPVDGVSLVDRLTGAAVEASASSRLLFSYWRNRLTVRSERFRYHSDGRLFDIAEERGETTDLRDSHPSIAKRLDKQLTAWKASWPETGDEINRPFPIGHPEATWTQLPARDAEFRGTIERSNRFPNCTYLKNWTDTDSEITWDVDVLGSGSYEVQMYYACPSQELGSTVELSLGEQSILAKIERAVESPLIGAEEDRVPRQESYVRRWEPMTLGVIELTPGRAKLRLRAKKVVGAQVAEMRLLMFRRLE